ncbi:MAG: 16S rRNA (uracil(1498)-N(3))-methyltransferase, partial [Planctomycetaceae bacterium]
GPEGGFTTQEVALLHSAAAQFMAWPDTILRTETAAVVFATLLLHAR